MLAASVSWLPKAALKEIAGRSVDWYLMTEDLPDPDNRIALDASGRTIMAWKANNLGAHKRLVKAMTRAMQKALKGVPEKPLGPPEGVISVRINPDTGLRDDGGTSIAEYFFAEYPPAGGRAGCTVASAASAHARTASARPSPCGKRGCTRPCATRAWSSTRRPAPAAGSGCSTTT